MKAGMWNKFPTYDLHVCITCISVELLTLFTNTEFERDLGLPYHSFAVLSQYPLLIIKKKSIVRYVPLVLQHSKKMLGGTVCKDTPLLCLNASSGLER